jgi:hypothetical protein
MSRTYLRVRAVAVVVTVFVVSAGCGSTETPSPEAKPEKEKTSATASPSPSPSPTTPATTAPKPTPKPKPPAPSFTTREKAKKFFDGLDLDAKWESAPTPKKRPRYLGVAKDTSATIELFGPEKAVDEIAYQVVFDGTGRDENFDRALPMIHMAQKYASEKAAMFVGDELDGYTEFDAIPDRIKTKKFGKVYVRMIGMDVINTVNVTISIGHKPTPAK